MLLLLSPVTSPRPVRLGAHNFHLLPVVRKFLPAVQANHVGSSRKCGAAARAFLDGDRKTVTVVPAAEERINDRDQTSALPPTECRKGWEARRSGIHLLRFSFSEKGSSDRR